MNLNSNTHSQRGRWERGRSPVRGDCYHTIINSIFKTKSWLFFIPNVGAMAIAPYGFSDIKSLSAKLFFMPIFFLRNFFKYSEYDNLPYFSLKLFFNVKITLLKQWSQQ